MGRDDTDLGDDDRCGRTVNEVAVELGRDWHTVNDAAIAYGTDLFDDPKRIVCSTSRRASLGLLAVLELRSLGPKLFECPPRPESARRATRFAFCLSIHFEHFLRCEPVVVMVQGSVTPARVLALVVPDGLVGAAAGTSPGQPAAGRNGTGVKSSM